MSISERIYPVDFKEHFFETRNRISSSDAKIIAEKYESGCSLRDLAKLFGYSKSKIRSTLKRRGLKPRVGIAQATNKRSLMLGKQGALPYYGFCCFEGQIVKDPREFPILQMIHRHWSQGKSIHRINLELNRAKILSRKGKTWSWAAIQNIVVIAFAATRQLDVLQAWVWRAQAKVIYESRSSTWGSPRFFIRNPDHKQTSR